ncbi:HAD family hydrolase [Novosphingobium lentum]|uniref:HAD family hydrolase n=1 Tax=Novosphingobium lentum TaxID=145287 RepID=UPI000834E7B7|nr:HAD-IA family hydrolase [Novosphingobium lentum]
MTAPVANIVFDLDGTLIDSAPVFVEVLNAMLADRGSARRVTQSDIRPFASLGGPALVSGVLAQECGDLRQEVDDFRARYRLYPTPIESLYDGVADGVKALSAHGFRLAICSNKPQQLCEKVIADVGLTEHFPVIVGSSPDRMAKPAPDLMELVMAQLGTTVHDCLYVGDSEIDQALAKATGVRFAFVTYGYATEQFTVGQQDEFSRFSDLVRWVTTERAAILPARGAA